MIPVTKELCMKKVESVKNYVSNIDELEKKINALNIDSTSNKNDTINITPLATYDNGTDTVRTETWIELKLDAYYQGGTRYKFTQNATWLTNPLYRETDVFAIGHSTTFANEADTEYCKYTWDVRYTADGTYRFGETQSKSWYRAPKRDAGGIGFTIPLASTYNSEYAASQGNGILTWENTNHRIFMSYWGNVNPNGLVDAYVIVFGHYAHQQREFTGVTPSFSIPLGGSLSLDSESTYDVADNTAIRLRVNY